MPSVKRLLSCASSARRICGDHLHDNRFSRAGTACKSGAAVDMCVPANKENKSKEGGSRGFLLRGGHFALRGLVSFVVASVWVGDVQRPTLEEEPARWNPACLPANEEPLLLTSLAVSCMAGLAEPTLSAV